MTLGRARTPAARLLVLVGLALGPVLGSLFLLPGAPAQAAEPRRRAPGAIEILIATAPGEEEAAERSLLGPLRALGLDVRPARGAGFDPGAVASPGIFARVFVDLRPTAPEVLLLVVDGPTGQLVARRVIAREGSGEVLREQAAFILESLIEAKMESDQVASEAAARASASASTSASASAPPSAAPPASAPPESQHSPPSAAIELAPFLSAGLLSPQTQVSGGAGLAVGLTRGDRAIGAWLLARLLAPTDTAAGSAQLRTGFFSARFLPTARLLGGPSLSLDLGLGGGLDLLSLTPSSSGDAIPRASSRQISAVLSGVLRAQAQLSGSTQLFAAGLVDTDLSPRRYVVAQGNAQEVLFAPSAWRPSLLLGLTVSLTGASP